MCVRASSGMTVQLFRVLTSSIARTKKGKYYLAETASRKCNSCSAVTVVPQHKSKYQADECDGGRDPLAATECIAVRFE